MHIIPSALHAFARLGRCEANVSLWPSDGPLANAINSFLHMINGLFQGCIEAMTDEYIPNSTLNSHLPHSNVHTGMGTIYVVIIWVHWPFL